MWRGRGGDGVRAWARGSRATSGKMPLVLSDGTSLLLALFEEGIEALSVKVGTVLMVLGGMHFFNLFIFSRMRRRATMRTAPPVYPDAFTPVQEV